MCPVSTGRYEGRWRSSREAPLSSSTCLARPRAVTATARRAQRRRAPGFPPPPSPQCGAGASGRWVSERVKSRPSEKWKIGTGRVTAERAAHVSAGGSYSTRPSAMQNLEDESAIAQAEGSRVHIFTRNKFGKSILLEVLHTLLRHTQAQTEAFPGLQGGAWTHPPLVRVMQTLISTSTHMNCAMLKARAVCVAR